MMGEFEGFDLANYTQVPNAFFDGVIPLNKYFNSKLIVQVIFLHAEEFVCIHGHLFLAFK